MPGLRRTLILTAVAVGTFPAASQAATLNVTAGGVYTYSAGAGVANNLQATAFSGFVSFFDQASDPITVTGDAAGTCTGSGSTSVSCTQAPASVTVNLGAETIADKAQLSAENASIGTINGGPGADDINGFGTLNGDLGNDLISANNSSGGTLNGNDGDDVLKSGDGTETFNGGPGVDTVDYTTAFSVVASIDGVANDGPVGQNDNVKLDVENLVGTPGNDVLSGTANGSSVGNVFTPGNGNDAVDGKDGNDVLVAGRGQDGADTFTGGAGTDMVNYGARTENLRVRLDGNANDGEAGENDNLAVDVENVTAGFGDDFIGGQVGVVDNVFAGGLGEDDLHGGSGNDNLQGNPGNDVIDGAAGLDSIIGEEGNDDIDGGLGNDTISGGDGFDRIDAGAGTDTVNGAAGADTLLLRDGSADTATCGAGVDTVDPDPAGDSVDADCEHTGSGPSGLSAVAESFSAPAAALAPAPASTPAASGDGASVTVSCKIAGRKRAARRVTCKVRLPEGQARGLRARLSRKGKVYAVGRATASARRQTLSMRSVRRAKPGRYTLALRDAAGRRVMAVTVFVR